MVKYKSKLHHFLEQEEYVFHKIINGKVDSIPCLFVKADSQNLLIYFHGNGEDLNLSSPFLESIRDITNCNIIAVEYPGYSYYKDYPKGHKVIEEDAIFVYDYFVDVLKQNPKNILVLGRSIGSGPATYLASKRELGGLILLAGFTSLRDVVKQHIGDFLSYFIQERFVNIDNIKQVQWPTLLVHGKADNVIQCNQSKMLYQACGSSNKKLIIPNEMSHTEFDYEADFLDHLVEYFEKFDFSFFEVFFTKNNFPEMPSYLKEILKQ